ncbi:MAG: YggS family pyridoxal phosphate-dependent enzyme [Lawsonibacter sp.]|nr:YggS family pyridoxal phosphate-dependent enzyme [Lawsonibacter sp.]
MDIQERVREVQRRLARAAEAAGRAPAEITLCAATKTQDCAAVRAAVAAGISVCGENRVQELAAHLEEGAYAGAEVHFIGRLQTNKVNKVVGRAALIHSVDSLRLLQTVESQAARLGVRQDILLEINIGREDSKGGIDPGRTEEMARAAAGMEHIRLRGLMAIPPISAVPGGSRHFFAEMYQLFVDIRTKMSDNQYIDCLSMGMSGDFEDAIAEGATLVRVGTALFGPRPPVRTAQP